MFSSDENLVSISSILLFAVSHDICSSQMRNHHLHKRSPFALLFKEIQPTKLTSNPKVFVSYRICLFRNALVHSTHDANTPSPSVVVSPVQDKWFLRTSRLSKEIQIHFSFEGIRQRIDSTGPVRCSDIPRALPARAPLSTASQGHPPCTTQVSLPTYPCSRQNNQSETRIPAFRAWHVT